MNLLIADLCVTAGSIRPKRAQVVIATAPLRRVAIRVGMHPGVEGNLIALDIGSIPARCISRSSGQRSETLFCGGVGAYVQPIEIQHAAQPFDGLRCNIDSRATELAQHGRCNQANQQAKNRDYDQNFQQREAGIPCGAVGFGQRRRSLFQGFGVSRFVRQH